jgi:hypothetical protein
MTMSLKDKAMSMNGGNGIDFMDGRTKGDVKSLNDQTVTVIDFAYLTGDDGAYIVFIIKEDKEHFYFGASVMTGNFQEFTADEVEEIKAVGIPVKLYEKKNKKGNRTYQAIEFYPEL